MHSLYYLGIILFSGLIMGKLVSFIKLPRVTGYLIAGLIIGPSILSLVPASAASKLSIISEAALGFIAYSIGSSFNFDNLKKLGNGIIIITLFESLTAVVAVDFVLIVLLKQPVPFSLMLGAIAAATAPAATIMVLKQYNARGPLVDTLLPVVAIDDAVGIMAFGISMAIAKSLLDSTKAIGLKTIFLPVKEIALAFAIGIGIGVILSIISKYSEGQDQLLTITLATIFITVGIAMKLNISPLLTCMSIGATVSNIAPNSNRVLSIIDVFTPPVFVAFFTLAGVELNLTILKNVGLIGVVYIIVRVIGKILGAYLGAKLAKAPAVVQKYLGFTLIPQAGVAIGLAMVAETAVPEFGAAIRTIILSATIIYELIGPLITKIAIFKAGEAHVDESSELTIDC
ncbi:cation:proton antiporter [Clostridium sp. KNHs214]|uniref:cation:proton antiporter n=1 Tax=Clostridium sp. KNHs214 TaxID=1540257 RepID=UPI000558DDE4|nr:cation:proton antiporter [Clostridium sp. KNHs214]